MHIFNLNRDARPLATISLIKSGNNQVRVSISTEMPGPWRQFHVEVFKSDSLVSISTEMPGPWRPVVLLAPTPVLGGFNLNRDARPLATTCNAGAAPFSPWFQSQPRGSEQFIPAKPGKARE